MVALAAVHHQAVLASVIVETTDDFSYKYSYDFDYYNH